jgi:hypothetical protein
LLKKFNIENDQKQCGESGAKHSGSGESGAKQPKTT